MYIYICSAQHSPVLMAGMGKGLVCRGLAGGGVGGRRISWCVVGESVHTVYIRRPVDAVILQLQMLREGNSENLWT